MARKKTSKPDIALVGAGSLAGGLGPALRRAGYAIREVVSREEPASRRRAQARARRVKAKAVVPAKAALAARVVWLCVPDKAIADCAASLAPRGRWKGKVVLHGSGALASDELAALRARGAAVAALHPMMSFVRGGQPSLVGVLFAFEGDPAARPLARRLVRDLGGEFLVIRKEQKVLYHAWAAFGSPLLLATLAVCEAVGRSAGVPAGLARKGIVPMMRRTLENFAARGGPAAFSGPLVRGDTATVGKHLEALRALPYAREVYVALARAALEILPVQNREDVARLLDRTEAEGAAARARSAAQKMLD